MSNISHKDNASLDNICYLISYVLDFDEIGNQIKNPTETLAYCAECGVYSGDYYNAAQQGIKPETVLLVDTEGYSGQEDVRYNDTLYGVHRLYPRSDGRAELHLMRRVGS